VKLLLDENLSTRILSEVLDLYPGSSHVGLLGLSQTSDSIIWEQAKRSSFCIVSKDSDFQQRSLLFGAPPKVIFLKLGNCPTQRIVAVLRGNETVITAFWMDEDACLLVLGATD
jgi:predicted nuclease of predicted toxin-antitoxin system